MGKIKVAFIGSGGLDWSLIKLVHERADIEVVAIIDPSITTDFKTSVMVHDKVDGQRKLVNVTAKDSNTLLIGDKEVALIGIQKPEQIPWLDTGAELIFVFSGRITDHENAAAHFNVIGVPLNKDAPVVLASKASHCLDDLIKNWKDTRATRQTLVGPSSSNDWMLNIPDPVSTGDAKTVGYAFPNVRDSAPDHEVRVDMPLPEDDVGTPDPATDSRSRNSGARAQLPDLRESLSAFMDSHSNELGYWARVLDGVTRAAELATRAAELATRAAHLASLAWFTGTRLRLLIAEIAEIFN